MHARAVLVALLAGAAAIVAAGCGSSGTTAAVGTSATPSAVASSTATTRAAQPYSFRLQQNWLADGIRVSVRAAGGPPLPMLVDTGSNGVVIARSALGSGYRSLHPRQFFTGFTYSSSGNSYSGEWVLASLTISSIVDPSARPASTVPMMVRAVDQQCDVLGRCHDETGRPAVAMLGVGFDREQDGDTRVVDPHAGPGLNPFLQVVGMAAGTLPHSYLIGSGRLQLGVPAPAGVSTIALQRTAATGTADWTAPQVCLAVAGSVPAQCGSLLLDTGLSYAIVQVPAGIDPALHPATSAGARPTMTAGQSVTLTVPALANRVLYQFTVGGAGAPRTVEWGHDVAAHESHSFFNISRFALWQVDYFFDADSGRVGFRRIG